MLLGPRVGIAHWMRCIETMEGSRPSPESLAELYRWEGLTADSGRTATRANSGHADASPVVVHGLDPAGHL